MRRVAFMATVAIIVAAMSGCTQDDQVLAIDLTDDQPVTRTVPASGEMTISTPAGLSVTLPEGTVSPGTQVTAQLVDPKQIAGLPPEVASDEAFLLTFDEPPKKAPVVSFRNTLRGPATAMQLLSAIPVAVSVASNGQAPSGSIVVPSWSVAPANDASDDQAMIQEIVNRLKNQSRPDVSGRTQFPLPILDEIRHLVGDFADSESGDPHSPVDDPEIIPSGFTMSIEQFLAATGQDLDGYEPGPTCDDDPYACMFLYMTMATGSTPLRQASESPGGEIHRLIPEGMSSVSYGLVCTGIRWWGELVAKCDYGNVDARGSEKLIERYSGSIVAVNYVLVFMTLQADGTSSGMVHYDGALRVPMASGVTGYAVADSLNLSGTWSVAGDQITLGDYTFDFATPEPDELILTVSDSVKIKHNDGTESWEPVQVHMKLRRTFVN